jgi:Resolvase, N terminal domain
VVHRLTPEDEPGQVRGVATSLASVGTGDDHEAMSARRKTLRLVGYVRVSDVAGRSGASFISPGVQRERIAAWCSLYDAHLQDVAEELDESGGRADRPLLLKAIERVERGLSDGIIVAKLDRFGRSFKDALEHIERIDRAGARLIHLAPGAVPAAAPQPGGQAGGAVRATALRQSDRRSWGVASSTRFRRSGTGTLLLGDVADRRCSALGAAAWRCYSDRARGMASSAPLSSA